MTGSRRCLQASLAVGTECPLFFLPDLQRDGGDLTGQSQTRHLRLHSFLQKSEIELPEYSVAGAGSSGNAFEQVLQIMVVVLIQPSKGAVQVRASSPESLA